MRKITHRISIVILFYIVAGLYPSRAIAVMSNPCCDDDIPDDETIFYETFDAFDSTGGRDGKFTGNVATGTFDTSLANNNWKTSGSVFGACQCVRVGIADQDGSITTPELTLDGEATLICEVAGWGNGTNTMTITAQNATIGDNPKKITLVNKTFTRYTFQVTASGTFTLKFKGRRFFIDDIRLVKCGTGMENVYADGKTFSPRIHDLQGRQIQHPSKGLYIVNGKKTVKR